MENIFAMSLECKAVLLRTLKFKELQLSLFLDHLCLKKKMMLGIMFGTGGPIGNAVSPLIYVLPVRGLGTLLKIAWLQPDKTNQLPYPKIFWDFIEDASR